MNKIDCTKCHKQSHCCQTGAWVDLEEAKIIRTRGIKGEFYLLKKDDDFPSGFCVATSLNDGPCSFLTPAGLCAIHKVSYDIKPSYCKEFPYEDGEPSPHLDELCLLAV